MQKEQNHDDPTVRLLGENGGKVPSILSTHSPKTTTLQHASLSNCISDYFTRFTAHSIVNYLEANCPQVMEELGAATLSAREIGAGKFNLIFIVTNSADTEKKVIVKQVKNHMHDSSFELCAL
jgi:hypothetical protein